MIKALTSNSIELLEASCLFYAVAKRRQLVAAIAKTSLHLLGMHDILLFVTWCYDALFTHDPLVA